MSEELIMCARSEPWVTPLFKIEEVCKNVQTLVKEICIKPNRATVLKDADSACQKVEPFREL